MMIKVEVLKRKLKGVGGDFFPLPYPTDADKAKLPDDENGKPDMTKLPDVTIQDCVIDCLQYYESSTRKEGFYINQIAQLVLGEKDFEMKDKLRDFLEVVMDDAVMRKVKETKRGPDGKEFEDQVGKGLYRSFLIDQAMSALGYTVKGEEEKK